MGENMSEYAPTSAADALRVYGLVESDLERIRHFGQGVTDDELRGLVKVFYEWLPILPEAEAFFADPKLLAHVQGEQVDYWRSFLGAVLDERYSARRRVVGGVHARIGLSLEAYLAAMNQMLLLLIGLVPEKMSAEVPETIRALTQLVHLDTALVTETFTELTNRTIAKQSEAIVAMSTPVAEIADGILMLPVVGVIDTLRARDIRSAMLTRVRDTGAKVFILDISGVAVVDTAVANHLIRMTRATRLMGCECIVSGLSPAIAETIIALDLDISAVNTRASLKDALEIAFAKTGLELRDARA